MTVKALRESLGNSIQYSMLITYYKDGKEYLVFADHKRKLDDEIEISITMW